MDTPVLITGTVVVLGLLALVLLVLVRGRAESRRTLAAAQAETAELRARLDELTQTLERQSASMVSIDDPAYVITDAGLPEDLPQVPDRLVLSATLGEPLVKVAAFGHGMRRALSAESRNRIWFEVRREVRRARKQRRREMKQAWRRMQAEDRGTQAATQQTTRPATPPADAA